MNELWRNIEHLKLEDSFKWSVIDRWYEHPLFHECMLERIAEGMEQFDPAVRDEVIFFVLF